MFGKTNEHEKAILDLFDQIDIDKNGYLEFTEFCNACSSIQLFINDQNLIMAFQAIDHDGDGKASLNELREFFKNSVQLSRFCELVMKKADIDHDESVLS